MSLVYLYVLCITIVNYHHSMYDEMSSFMWQFYHWLHQQLSATKISSKWQQYRFSDSLITEPYVIAGLLSIYVY